jgi:diaminopropionate ammonia-lyase
VRSERFDNVEQARRFRLEEAGSREPLRFHERLPGYEPSPLLTAPGIAATLGVGRVFVKDESSRFGLPSFKILGASWAVYRALLERAGGSLPDWETFDQLGELLSPIKPLSLTAATDGNHGRAVARMASLLGLAAHILVPVGTARARIDAIASEGARVTVVDGDYDETIRRSAAESSDRCLVISDTSWPGYERVPRWIIEGYGTVLREVEVALAATGDHVDLVAAQIGVGAFACAVVRHFRGPDGVGHTAILGVEPLDADCALQSARAGKVVSVPGPHRSMMVGLNCGTPSSIAWPLLSGGIDLFVAIEDERAREAMRSLAAEGIVSGESGASGLGGLLDVLTGPSAEDVRRSLGVDDGSKVLVISTEGATDPEAYRQIVGKTHETVAARA